MRVAVIDDHPLVWQGIKAVLQQEVDMELVGWASNGQEALELISQTEPDVTLVDLRLPGESGLDIIQKSKSGGGHGRFVILTTYAEAKDVRRAVELGVDGYMLKEALPEEMISGIRLVAKGRSYFDPAVMQLVVNNKQGKDPLGELTEREQEVLAALGEGLSNKQIADKLYVTEYTIKKHVSSVLGKLGLKDRTQAALFAAKLS